MLVYILFHQNTIAQVVKAWDRTYGGCSSDFLIKILPLKNDGILLAGYSNSIADGNKTSANYGSYDYWMVRLDSNGQKLWEADFGGSGSDYLTDVIETGDGGFLLGGYSSSGISGIKTQTGEIFEVSEIEKAEAPSRARLIVRKDDILVSTTRPNRGAITLLRPKHDFHIASTGFAVIRDVREVSKEYLLLLLRHQICLTQMEQRSSGGNYPAITLDELQNIQIPIPPPENQKEIAERVEAIYAEAKLLREQGAEILKHAKSEVEQKILGES